MKIQRWCRFDIDDNWQVILPEWDINCHGIVEDNKNEVEVADWNCPCKPRIDWINKIIIHKSFRDEKRIKKSLNINFK